MDFFNQALWLIAQIGPAEGSPAPAANEAAQAGGGGMQVTGASPASLFEELLSNPLNLILISGFLFIFLVLRPQQKQMKQLQKSLANLKKNDRVVTASGIHGTVIQAGTGDATVILRIDDNSGARLTINRDAIARVVSEDSNETKAS